LTFGTVPTASITQAGWTSYTPSWTNLTVGDGTSTGSYVRIGNTVFFKVRFVFGSTSSITGGVSVTIPVTNSVSTGVTDPCNIKMIIRDASPAQNYFGTGRHDSATTIVLSQDIVSGTNIIAAALTSTSPITFTTNDILLLQGFYEVA